MAVYVVHEPPLTGSETSPDPERFAFVRDGFSFAAFLFGPLWMLWHRMWIVLLGYVLTAVVLQVLLQVVHASFGMRTLVDLMLALLIGFEAGTLRRFTLARRGWENVGIVVGDDLELAERRFFDNWNESGPRSTLPPEPPTPVGTPAMRMPAAGSDVIGLFPEAGASR